MASASWPANIRAMGGLIWFGRVAYVVFRRGSGWRRVAALLGIASLLAAAAIQAVATSWDDTPLVVAGVTLFLLPFLVTRPPERTGDSGSLQTDEPTGKGGP